MTSLRSRIDALYEVSCFNEAKALLMMQRLCDEGVPPSQWVQEIAKRKGPQRSIVEAMLRRVLTSQN